ncbi:twitchin-like isoform X1 [Asterias rubens]|uniref:twitchin-like isoform X1 n=1 Tax=Asterias rubens TaxID=7604 RepID=UPI001455C6DC|nr:twitchin-like isoform X1 [Asterias rubens]
MEVQPGKFTRIEETRHVQRNQPEVFLEFKPDEMEIQPGKYTRIEETRHVQRGQPETLLEFGSDEFEVQPGKFTRIEETRQVQHDQPKVFLEFKPDEMEIQPGKYTRIEETRHVQQGQPETLLEFGSDEFEVQPGKFTRIEETRHVQRDQPEVFLEFKPDEMEIQPSKYTRIEETKHVHRGQPEVLLEYGSDEMEVQPSKFTRIEETRHVQRDQPEVLLEFGSDEMEVQPGKFTRPEERRPGKREQTEVLLEIRSDEMEIKPGKFQKLQQTRTAEESGRLEQVELELEVKPEEDRPGKFGKPQFKPKDEKLSKLEPEEIKQTEVKPEEVKPGKFGKPQLKPKEEKPDKPEEVELVLEVTPEEVKPGKFAKPELKPKDEKPDKPKLEEIKPTEVKPEEVKPGKFAKPELKPKNEKPGKPEPAEKVKPDKFAKHAPEPEEKKPGRFAKPQLKPKDDKPSKPVPEPVEVKPVEVTPEEVKPGKFARPQLKPKDEKPKPDEVKPDKFVKPVPEPEVKPGSFAKPQEAKPEEVKPGKFAKPEPEEVKPGRFPKPQLKPKYEKPKPEEVKPDKFAKPIPEPEAKPGRFAKPQLQPKDEKPNKPQEPEQVKPKDAKPGEVKPGKFAKPAPEPEEKKPGRFAKPQLKPKDDKPSKPVLEPVEAKPVEVKPEEAKPGRFPKPQLKPKDEKPKPEEVKPDKFAKPVPEPEVKPGRFAKPKDAKPEEVKPGKFAKPEPEEAKPGRFPKPQLKPKDEKPKPEEVKPDKFAKPVPEPEVKPGRFAKPQDAKPEEVKPGKFAKPEPEEAKPGRFPKPQLKPKDEKPKPEEMKPDKFAKPVPEPEVKPGRFAKPRDAKPEEVKPGKFAKPEPEEAKPGRFPKPQLKPKDEKPKPEEVKPDKFAKPVPEPEVKPGRFAKPKDAKPEEVKPGKFAKPEPEEVKPGKFAKPQLKPKDEKPKPEEVKPDKFAKPVPEPEVKAGRFAKPQLQPKDEKPGKSQEPERVKPKDAKPEEVKPGKFAKPEPEEAKPGRFAKPQLKPKDEKPKPQEPEQAKVKPEDVKPDKFAKPTPEKIKPEEKDHKPKPKTPAKKDEEAPPEKKPRPGDAPDSAPKPETAPDSAPKPGTAPKPKTAQEPETAPVEEAITPMDQTPAESAPTPMEIEISPEGGIIPQQVQETHSAPKQRRMSATDYLDEEPIQESKPGIEESAPIDKTPTEDEGFKRSGQAVKPPAIKPAVPPPAVKMKDEGFAPSFIESPCKVQVVEGQSVKFEAVVEGNPKPEVTWYKGTNVINDGFKNRYAVKYFDQRDVHVLEVKKTVMSDTGKFSCKVENPNGKDERVFSLMVTDNPDKTEEEQAAEDEEKPATEELDFRAMLRHREVERRESKVEVPDWGTLKDTDVLEKEGAEITRPLKSARANERDGRIKLEIGARALGVKPTWYKDDKEITASKKYKIKSAGNDFEMTIVDLKTSDSGNYTVKFGDYAESKCNVVVDAAPPPGKPKVDYVTLLKPIEVHEGQDAKFTCELSGDCMDLGWYKNNEKVPPRDKKCEVKRLGRRHTLIVKDCRAADQGEIAISVFGLYSRADLTVKTKPKFVKELSPVSVVEGRSCALQCEISDFTSDVKWFKDGKPVTLNDQVVSKSDKGVRKLVFYKAMFDDTAEYTVKFTTLESKAKLSVTEPPNFSGNLPEETEAFAHEDAEFTTEVDSPEAEVFWFKNGKPLEPDDDKYEVIADGNTRKLIIKDVGPSDQANYACALDETRATRSNLKVQAPPTLKVPLDMEDIVVKAGEPVEVNLDISGSPAPKVEWSKPGVSLVPDDRTQMVTMPENATLLITHTDRDDTNEYTVNVSNKHGTETANFKITVIDKPQKPENVKIVGYDEHSVSLAWKPPTDNGNCQITHYIVEYKETKRGDWAIADDSVTSPEFTVPDLTEGKEYIFRVAAVNEVGTSEPTQCDRPQVAKEPFEPADQMEPPVVVDTHDGSIELKWSPPDFDGGCPITGYIIEKREAGSPRWSKAKKEPIKGNSFEVPSLSQGAEYEFRVIAVNKAGESEPSKPSKPALAREPIDPTLPPGQPVIEDVTKDSVTLSWDKPEDDGGSPIKGYYVEKKNPQTGEWERVNKKPIKDTKFKVPDLVEGEEYEFRILAENEAGMSEPSVVSPPVVAKDPEIPPSLDVSQLKDLTIKAGQNIKLVVAFTGTPTPKASWTLDEDEIIPDERTKVRGAPTNTELVVMDARRSDTGVYTVVVTNPFGTEKGTSSVNVLDKPSPPKGPIDVSDVTASSCVLTWQPPADDGGQPISNYVIEKRDIKRSGWSVVNDTTKDTTVKITKLQEGTEYMFRVAAESSFGVSKPLETPHTVLAKNPYDEPGAPGVPEVTDYDHDFVELEWSPPEDDGGADIEGYVIEKKEKASTRWMDATDKPIRGNHFKVPNLGEGRTYEFRVSAVNKAGKGKPSKVSEPKLVKAKFSKPVLRIDRLKDVKIRSGQELKLQVPFDGSPPPTVTWKKNGSELQPSDRVVIDNSDELTIVRVRETERDDTGEYELILTNDSGTLNAKCNVNILDKPSPPEGPLQVTDITNESCRLSWNPPADDGGSEIANYHVEKRESDDDYWTKCSSFVQSPGFTVPKLSRGKEYVFRVMAENAHGGVSGPLESAPITAKNPYDEPDAPGKPKIVSYDRDRADLQWSEPVSDGGDAITGYIVEKKEPKASRWSRVNKSPILSTKFSVPGLIQGRQYEFRVVAENRAGPSQPSAESDIMTAKPEFEKPAIDTNAFSLRDIKVKQGEPFDIKVPFTASPAPDAIWYKDNRELKTSPNVEVEITEEVATLRNKASERGDSGKYKVTLENDSGTDSVSLTVTVLSPPLAPKAPLDYSEFQKDSVKLTWNPPEHDGNGTITGYVIEQRDGNRDNWSKVTSSASQGGYTVKNLINHNDYAFRVSAVNQYGVSEPLDGRQVKIKLPFDEPDSPSVPKIDAIDRNSAALSWSSPLNDGGSPVTGYVVEYRPTDSNKWSPANSYPTKEESYTVPGLAEGQEYQFRVIALNEAGPGKPSRATESVVAKAPILPADAPGRPSVDKVRKDHIGVSWTRPVSDGGSKIIDYVVEKRKVPDSGHKGDWVEAVKVSPKEEQAIVPDLEEGEQYEFRVRANTEAGPPGKPSTPTPAVTAEDRPERPVLDISSLKDIKVKGGDSFDFKLNFTGVPKPEITWELNGAPVKEDGRSIIKSTHDVTALIVESARRSNGGRYTITLKNSAGSDTGKVKVVVLDAPDTPEGPLKVFNITPDSASLSWRPPKDGPDDVENYIVEKKDGDTGTWNKVSSFCATPNIKVRNLQQGTEYMFRVSAENQYGSSKPLLSEPIIAKHPFDAPGAPQAPQATQTDRTAISIAWKPPTHDGGNPISSYIVEKREAGMTKWSPATRAPVKDTSCSVPKLNEGTDYEFRVTAQNEAGPGRPSEASEAITAAPPSVKPKIRGDSRSKDVTVLAGEPFRVDIPFESTPAPHVTMTQDDKGGAEVSFGGRFNVEESPETETISCKRSERSDSGKYTVTLRNNEGADTCSLRVTVVDKPGPPEAPLEVTDVTAESAKLAWNPPKDDGGSRITNYVVEKREGVRSWNKVTSFVRVPNYNVGDLDEGQQYFFRVRAENQYGVGEPLEQSTAVVAKNPYDVSDAPGKPVIEEVDRGFVSMTWEAPHNDGGAKIAGYNVEKREPDMDWVQCNSYLVKDTRLSLSNLKETNEYEFRVIAKNSAGLSPPSRPSNAVIPKPQYSVSDKPGVPEVESVTPNSADLTWSAPSSDGGSRISGYTVEKREIGAPTWQKANRYPLKEPKFTLDGLEDGKEYEVRVIAENAAGPSEPSHSETPIKAKEAFKGTAPFFDRRAENITGCQGDTTRFEVAVSGNPEPTVKWYKNGLEIFSGARVSARQHDEVFLLTLNDLKDADSGEYTCEASNKNGTEKCKAKLVVHMAPSVGMVPRDITVEVGQPFKMKIPFTATGEVTARCTRDGEPVEEGRVKVNIFDDYAVMSVKEAESLDNANFKVNISNDAGMDTASFAVKVLDAPGAPRGPLEVGVVTNHSIQISWKPPSHNGGLPVKSYVVEKKEEGTSDWIPVSSYVTETHFTVPNLQTGVPYELRVSAENEIGVGKPLSGDGAIVAKSPYDAPGKPGEPDVSSIGRDFVVLTWTRPHSDGGSPISGYTIEKTETGNDRWVQVTRGPVMQLIYTIPNLIEDREYDFRVFAINEAGLISEPAVGSNPVLVKDPNEVIRPKFVESLRDITAHEGRTVSFECTFSGKPQPDVKWFKGTREIFNNNKYQGEIDGNSATLTVNDVKPEDAEEYSCEIRNKGGRKLSRGQLVVKFAPRIRLPARLEDTVVTFLKTEDIKLKIPVTGYPKPESSWTVNGRSISRGIEDATRHSILTVASATRKDSGQYEIIAENEVGSDSAVIHVSVHDVPLAPTDLQASDVSHESVELNWTAPADDGGCRIDAYILEKRERGAESWSRAGFTSGLTSHVVIMLTPNKEYKYRVRAENTIGSSEHAEVSHTISMPEPEKPIKMKIVAEEESEMQPQRRRLPKVHDYDSIVDESFAHKKVKLRKTSPRDRYEFGEELGRGDYGVVQRCLEKPTGRNFAGKLIDVESSDKEYIKHEMDTMSALQHPRLLQLHDAYDSDNQMVMILDFLSGGDIFDRIKDRDQLSEEEVARYTKQVLEGLNYLHLRNYMHLDLKPQSIIYETKKSSNIRIIDLGMATKLNPEERVKVALGSPEYSSPELLNGQAVGFSNDMWSVGVIVYMLLSGIHPFGHDAEKIKRGRFDFDQGAFRNISDEAKDFISKLLVVDTEQRIPAYEALDHPWLKDCSKWNRNRIPIDRHMLLLERPGWMPGTQSLGIGRISNTSGHRRRRPLDTDFVIEVSMSRKEARPRFVRRPIDTFAMEDRDATFNCVIAAPSDPVVSWFKDNKELKQSLKYKSKYDDVNYQLVVSRVQLDEAGQYVVRAVNSYGELTKESHLAVEPDPMKHQVTRKRRVEQQALPPARPDSKPLFTFRLRPRTIQEGTSVRLSCIVAGYPEPKVTWMRNGEDIPKAHPDFKQEYSYRMAVLEIDRATVQTCGRFTCIAQNCMGTEETECVISVEDRSRRGGASSTTEYSSSSSSSARRSKRREELTEDDTMSAAKTIQQGFREYKHKKESVSESIVETEDGGQRTKREKRKEKQEEVYGVETFEKDAEGKESGGQFEISASAEIDIDLGDPETEKAALTIQAGFKGMMARKKEAEDEEGHEDEEGGVIEEVQDTGEMEIIIQDDANVEEATMDEQAGENESAGVAEGYKGPVMVVQPEPVSVDEGLSAKFYCKLMEAADEVFWLQDDRALEDGGRFSLVSEDNEYRLEIPMALSTDTGKYTFKAKNAFGECQTSFSLQVILDDAEPVNIEELLKSVE